jgi:hypothetical protein
MRRSIPGNRQSGREFVKRVKKAQANIKKGKGKIYDSVDDFFKEIEA